ncbi:MAG: sugar phosphate isomerase/epimerase, partial [Oscillospiraceae bacterium]|nr:sugar phosphate isomerase/epimerase [Oscillospiraceae bacterium]
MRYGLQMFGLNPIFLKDKEAFLRRITSAGYRYMEPCLAMEEIPGLEDRVWTLAQLEENAALLNKYGVKINSCHLFTRDIEEELHLLCPLAEKYSIRQFVLPCPIVRTVAAAGRWSRKLNRAVAELAKVGAELLLHNGKEDSCTRIDGISVYELMLRECAAVGAQADVGWLLYGGIDPETFLWKNKDRVRSLHYKDMEQTADGFDEIGVGKGEVDMAACFQCARAVEIIQIVDQDGSRGDFIDDMEFVAQKLRMLSQERDRTSSILCVMDTQTGEVTQL